SSSANAAAPAKNQHGFPCFGLPHLEHIGPHGKKGFRNGWRLCKAYTFRNIQGLAFWYDTIFCITTTIGQATDFITNFKLAYLSTDCNHFTRDFKARDWCYAFWHWIQTLTLQNVWTINSES